MKNSLGCGDWGVDIGDLWVGRVKTDAESAERGAEDAEKDKGKSRNGDECGIRAGWAQFGT